MSTAFQARTDTAFDRHPNIFSSAQIIQPLLQEHNSTPRILSYGCSSGQELRSIQKYFPRSSLYGCDVDAQALSSARTVENAIIFESNEANVLQNAPFDLIFAMSVLCHHGRDGHVSIGDRFPFSAFSDAIALLTSSLSKRGILVLYNPSYFIEDTDSMVGLSYIRAPAVLENGFVDRYSADGELEAARRTHLNVGYYDFRGTCRPDASFSNVFLIRREASDPPEYQLNCVSLYRDWHATFIDTHWIDDRLRPPAVGKSLHFKRSIWTTHQDAGNDRIVTYFRNSTHGSSQYIHATSYTSHPAGGPSNGTWLII